jgi:2-methylcitrate dehydratase PrpD
VIAKQSSTAASVTREAANFSAELQFEDLPSEAGSIAVRCVLDGIAVALAGTEQPVVRVIDEFIGATGGAREARPIGARGTRVAAPLAALRNGVAGHAMDWDDTQLAEGEGRVYGLLTHPTMPPLAAGLAVADMIGEVTGERFIASFVAGFEVECKLALAIAPSHYLGGFHSSGTIGTFGAAVTAAKLLGLGSDEIAQTLGVAASMASGIRANFGTMVKPLHVGRAAQNGVIAPLLVRHGLRATDAGLDGAWGYLSVAGGEDTDLSLALGRFGQPLSILTLA